MDALWLRTRWLLGVLLWLGLSLGSASAVSLGQVDDFGGDTTQGWGSGRTNPNPPSLVSGGGPQGADDAFLRVAGNGSDGAGSSLVAFNVLQWSGDYLGAEVTAIEVWLRNLGPGPLAIRLLLEGPGGSLLSAEAASLPPEGDWQRARFPVDVAGLVGSSTRDPAETLGGVTKLRIQHAPTLDGSEPVLGELGVDDIRAVPEPASLLLLGSGLALLCARRSGAGRA